jgi:hypothetical protein
LEPYILLRYDCVQRTGAGEESRTLDLNLGKVALYQLSYSRILQDNDYRRNHAAFQG